MIESFADDVRIANGPTVNGAGGFHFPTRMVIVRLESGGLFVWSPIALTADLRDAVDALGPVEHIIGPNSLHHLFIPDWAAAWPQARLHAAPGLDTARPDIRFDTILGDTPDPAWAGTLDQVVMRGNAITTETVFFHRPSGTVIVTDLIQHLPDDWFSGWRRLIATWDRMTGPRARRAAQIPPRLHRPQGGARRARPPSGLAGRAAGDGPRRPRHRRRRRPHPPGVCLALSRASGLYEPPRVWATPPSTIRVEPTT